MLFSSIRCAPRRVSKVDKFTGSYLDTLWCRRFILGYVLQRYAVSSEKGLTSNVGDMSSSSHLDTTMLLHLQRTLSDEWKLAVKPLDADSTTSILQLIGRYAVGQGSLSCEAIAQLDGVLRHLSHGSLNDPSNAKKLLERVGFLAEGDNIRRLCFRGDLTFAEATLSFLEEHLDPVDPYDSLRETVDENIYAIDSASTSEVDDAIGIHCDEHGVEWITVYVSDATVHCPFDSTLERATARTLTTTTYLPENVYFMLPREIVEAATLREDRPCRTFNITFRMDDVTGALQDFKISVGWVKNLRRITYDAVQELYDRRSLEPLALTPSWCTSHDIKKLHRIHDLAKLRLEKRMSIAKNKIESNLPDPLIKVKGTAVLSVQDQILSTKDARIAVAEFMIAANEVCSRVAQMNKIPIPFRGTRILSRDHEVAKLFREPTGVDIADANCRMETSSDHQTADYFARAIFKNIAALSSVTRAIYSHEPIFHTGLETSNYTHSTSPLRRYADMLVHHQLKVNLALRSGGKRFEEMIPEYQMASLCSMISTKQEQSAVLQDVTCRYWLLRYIAVNLLQNGQNRHRILQCLVGCSRDVSAAPDYYRSPLNLAATHHNGNVSIFVSDVYLPELQMTHVIFHNRPDVRVGTTLEVTVARIDPDADLLELKIERVLPYEASAEDIMRQALVPLSDS